MHVSRVVFWRICLGVLLLFEIFVMVGVTDFTPTFTTLGLMITALAGLGTLEWVHATLRRGTQQTLPWWIISIVVIAVYLDAGGDYAHLYDRIHFFDAILHFTIPFVFTFCLIWVLQLHYTQLPVGLMVLFGITIMISFGALYEIEEYLEDFLIGSNRFGDAFDTGSDLLLNVLGAGLAGILFWFKQSSFVRIR